MRNDTAQSRQGELRQSHFQAFKEIVYRHSGINLQDGKQSLVSARIQKRMRALELDDPGAYLKFLEQDKSGDELILLIDAISTNVTSFWRECAHFELLHEILSELRDQGQSRVRVWSAASSTGEEPYCIAMTAMDVHDGRPGDFKLLATDISTRALSAARAGVYSAEKVKPLPAAYRNRWLDRRGRGDENTVFAVREEVKRLVTYRRLNLSTPPFPMQGPLDVVFCRNVMIYFDDMVRRRLLEDVARLLKPGGYLMVGHAESLTGMLSALKCVKPSVYRKV